MPIPDIRLQNIRINDIFIPEPAEWMTSSPPTAIPIYPPVTSEIGTPIVNIPGCVEAHKDNQENVSLKDEDPESVMTLCDAGTPSFSPIDYDTNKLDITQEAPPPPAYKAPETKPPETPETQTPGVPRTPGETIPECPTREQVLKNPIGKVLEGNKKIVDYELVGKECLMVTEQLTIPDQIIYNIPNAGMVTTTASIAVVATSSALLAKPIVDILLKVVKPAVKKTIKKIQTALGKAPPKLSQTELQTNRYREKKGLSPLKFGKKKKK